MGYILGASGSMDIANFLRSVMDGDIPDDMVALSKEVISNLMTDLEADPAEWSFKGTRLQATWQLNVDVFDVWDTYKGLMICALQHTLPEDDKLQQQVDGVLHGT